MTQQKGKNIIKTSKEKTMSKTAYEYTENDFNGIDIEHMTLAELATYLRCSTGKVRTILVQLNWLSRYKRPERKVRAKQQALDINLNDFKKEYTYKNIQTIAKEHNCTVKAVQEYMKQNNIEVNKKKTNYTKRLGTIYDHMINRCYKKEDKTYKYYGARGIKVCKAWLENRKAFYAWAINNGYKESSTLDRINVNGNYAPDNCRWVGMNVQNYNKRNTRRITYKGTTKTLPEWEEDTGIPKTVIADRIYKYKWSIDRALTTPKLK